MDWELRARDVQARLPMNLIGSGGCRAPEFLDTELNIIMLPFVANCKHFYGIVKVFDNQASG
jgi:hypothetical protein